MRFDSQLDFWVWFVFFAAIICLYQRQKAVSRYKVMRSHYITIIMALASAIDVRDPTALGHTERVMGLSRMLGVELNRRGYKIDLDSLKLAALLHDVGKVAIPESILQKPSSLSQEEWKQIKKHPGIGANMLAPLYELKDVKDAVYYHQEHYDGTGYPKGLKTGSIPLMSRIIMIIDAYDAMTSDRSYRKRMPDKQALDELVKNAGKQFDPNIADAFMKVIKAHQSGPLIE